MKGFNYNNTEDWFDSDDVRYRVQRIIHDRLADDRNQIECRFLMRFYWHLSMGYTEVTYEELTNNLSLEKMEILNELFEAIEKGSEYIVSWADYYETTLPNIDLVRNSNPN